MNQPTKRVRVVCFRGESDLRLKADSGWLELEDHGLILTLESATRIPFASVDDVELVSLHKVGTLVRLRLADGNLSLMVPRLNFGGFFVIVNRMATRRLYEAVHEARLR